MNNDLISRSALLEQIANHSIFQTMRVISRERRYGFEITKADMHGYVVNAPAVDAEVVRHGKWKPYYEPMECFVDVYLNTEIRDVHMGWICSECGRYEQSGTAEEMPYCHCGAKMDGGAKNAAD